MTEAELLEDIRRQAHGLGLLIYHHHDSRRDYLFSGGFPDLVIISRSGRGVVFPELKSPGGQLSRPQQLWRRALEANGLTHLTWRPRDLASGEVGARLRILAS